jgi:hypothetical protein
VIFPGSAVSDGGTGDFMRLYSLAFAAFATLLSAVAADLPVGVNVRSWETVPAILPLDSQPVWKIAQLSASDAGSFRTAENGTRYLTLRFHTNGAFAARVHLTDVHLPAGAALFAYGLSSGEVTNVAGPYRSGDAGIDASLWTSAVRGSEVVLELQEGADTIADLPFTVAAIASVSADEVPATTAAANAREVRTSLFRGIPLTHEVVGGLAVFEGDIVLGEASLMQTATGAKGAGRSAVAITGSNYRWPAGVIPYSIDPTMPNTARITDAIAHWNTVMQDVVKLIPRTNESAYVYFYHSTNASQCASNVGRLGYDQYLWVGDYCGTGNMIHEIGHAFGLWHEQSREDRNRYVTINFGNIDPNSSFNFNQNIFDGDDINAYDYGSIMHYAAYAFSINGLPTIDTIPAGIPIGQRSGLSAGDIAGIRAMYPGSNGSPGGGTPSQVAITVSSNVAGMPTVVDGVTYTASTTFNWLPGSTHIVSAPNPSATADTRYVFQNWSDGGAGLHVYTTPASASGLKSTYRLGYAVSAMSSGAGTATVAPASTDEFYAALSSVTVQATPSAGSCFTGWTNLLGGTPATATLSVTQPYRLTANFQTGTVSLNPGSLLASGNGGSYVTTVTASAGCAWAFQPAENWIRLRTTQTVGGSTILSISLEPNDTGLIRNAVVPVGNASMVIWQAPKR